MGTTAPAGKVSGNAGWSINQRKQSISTDFLPMQTETLFHTYSQYASMTNIPAKPSEEEERTENQLNEILEKVTPRSPQTALSTH